MPKALLYTFIVFFSCFSSLAFAQCDLPSPYEGNTGANMTVMLTPTFISSLNISEENAFIVAISTDGLVIGSVFLYDVSQISLPVWGDDSYTTEIDGALANEPISFQLVNGTDLFNVEMPVSVLYVTDGLSEQTTAPTVINGCPTLGCMDAGATNYNELVTVDDYSCTYSTPIEYQLSTGWNIVGFTACEITPIEEAVNNALGNSAGISNTFQIIKDVRGKFWHSSLGEYSALTQLTPGEGYMMYVNGETTTVQFSAQYCNDITYQLNSGWNMVAFTGDENSDNNLVSSMDNALGNSAGVANTIEIIKNASGQFWLPVFSMLSNFTPGEAYMMYVIGEPTTVSFTDNSTQIFENNPAEEFVLPITDNNMSVLFPAGTLNDFIGEQVYATINGQVVSENSTINEDGSAGITIVGQDYQCDCFLAQTGDIPIFVIENENETIYFNSTQLNYSSNSVSLIDNIYFYGNCDICSNPAYGCTDPYALNFDSSLIDDGSCIDVVYGCLNSNSFNYNPSANVDDNFCFPFITGCLDVTAYNYLIPTGNTQLDVNTQDNSCIYSGCTDSTSINYSSYASVDDGTCIPVFLGCTDSLADSFNPMANTENGTCVYIGCTNPTAVNFDPQANFDNQVCIVFGCMQENATNYNTEATVEDSSCIYGVIEGCTNTNSCNYNEFANLDDGTCSGLTGCLDNSYIEYSSIAECNNQELCVTTLETNSIWESLYYYAIDSAASSFAIDEWEDSLLLSQTILYYDAYLAYVLDSINYNYELQFAQQNQMYLDSIAFYFAIDALEDSITLANTIQNEAYLTYVLDSTIYNYELQLALQNQLYLDSIHQVYNDTDSLILYNNYLLDELTYWSSSILINLVQGWNIIGYTSKEPQDVVATLQGIEGIILIVKNNAAEVYWPEFGFNGIGNLIPGQGYQIKVSEEYIGFTYPDVNGERIELTPTVPQWAIDIQVVLHPNDIRTLVKVVNMLGQEVNPETQSMGTILLYLYNDATVEKMMTK